MNEPIISIDSVSKSFGLSCGSKDNAMQTSSMRKFIPCQSEPQIYGGHDYLKLPGYPVAFFVDGSRVYIIADNNRLFNAAAPPHGGAVPASRYTVLFVYSV
jgi:hypothetical protein